MTIVACDESLLLTSRYASIFGGYFVPKTAKWYNQCSHKYNIPKRLTSQVLQMQCSVSFPPSEKRTRFLRVELSFTYSPSEQRSFHPSAVCASQLLQERGDREEHIRDQQTQKRGYGWAGSDRSVNHLAQPQPEWRSEIRLPGRCACLL